MCSDLIPPKSKCENLLSPWDRIFFISNKGELIGTRAKRIPRKKKKALKKSGLYQGNPMQGFPIHTTLDIGPIKNDLHQIPLRVYIKNTERLFLWPQS